MSEKKIATSIDILVNVDRYEHIEITKYGERIIQYDTDEKRIIEEDKLTKEIMEDGLRSLDIIAKTIGGKTTEPVNAIKDKIRKKIPTWLEEESEPNLANLAESQHKKHVAKKEVKKIENLENQNSRSDEISESLGENINPIEDNDTLDDIVDKPANKQVSEDKTEQENQSIQDSKIESDNNNDDEDLFGNDDDLFS